MATIETEKKEETWQLDQLSQLYAGVFFINTFLTERSSYHNYTVVVSLYISYRKIT